MSSSVPAPAPNKDAVGGSAAAAAASVVDLDHKLTAAMNAILHSSPQSAIADGLRGR